MTVNENFLRVDVQNLELIVRQLISENPELVEDEDLLGDMLEGSTDFDSVMTRLVLFSKSSAHYADATKIVIDDVAKQRKRWEKRAAVARGTMLRLMQLSGLSKRVLPVATISLAKPRTSVAINDADLIPDEFVEMVRKVDERKVKDALEAGRFVPGATLTTGNQILMVR